MCQKRPFLKDFQHAETSKLENELIHIYRSLFGYVGLIVWLHHRGSSNPCTATAGGTGTMYMGIVLIKAYLAIDIPLPSSAGVTYMEYSPIHRGQTVAVLRTGHMAALVIT